MPPEGHAMLTVHKKLVVDEQGQPREVILPYEEYLQIEEILGLDLDAEAIADLEEAARDRKAGTPGAYLDLESL
jgi:PHD/YefM family antitoxin component YafN of YafNO toxin-antitoxin module